MDLDYKKVGIRIKEHRKAKGYTQEQLANMLGISIPYMSHIETADTKVGLQTLIKIANALEVSANDLLHDSLNVCADSYPEYMHELMKRLDPCTKKQRQQLIEILDELKRVFCK